MTLIKYSFDNLLVHFFFNAIYFDIYFNYLVGTRLSSRFQSEWALFLIVLSKRDLSENISKSFSGVSMRR